jgi:hypothetical protein
MMPDDLPMNGLIIFFLFAKKKKNNKIGFATMML